MHAAYAISPEVLIRLLCMVAVDFEHVDTEAAVHSRFRKLSPTDHMSCSQSSDPALPQQADLCPDPSAWQDVCVNGKKVRLPDSVRHKGLCLVRLALCDRHPSRYAGTKRLLWCLVDLVLVSLSLYIVRQVRQSSLC